MSLFCNSGLHYCFTETAYGTSCTEAVQCLTTNAVCSNATCTCNSTVHYLNSANNTCVNSMYPV